MINENKTLDLDELIEETYNKLSQKKISTLIKLQNEDLTEIYKEVRLFDIYGKTWAIVKGKNSKQNDSLFNKGIFAFEFTKNEKETKEQLKKRLEKKIEEDDFFPNSIIIGKNNEDIYFDRNGRFGNEMFMKTNPEIKKFTSKNLPKHYHSNFADYLSNTILKILEPNNRYFENFSLPKANSKDKKNYI